MKINEHPDFAVTGIGNAIVDVTSKVDDVLIENEGLPKGSMSLIEADRALALCSKLTQSQLGSGGSAANTIAGLASLGSRVGFIGKIGNDDLGHRFTRGLEELGIEFRTTPSQLGTPTARCIVLVSSDAQRTMSTYLGACTELGPEDIDEALIRASQFTYLEGYLWDPPRAKEAFLVAAEMAHGAKRKVALSLSDSFCVARHRDSFLDLVAGHVDVLFANETEITGLFQTDDLQAALAAARETCPLTVATAGAAGSFVVERGQILQVPAEPISRLVDTTGAGDLYAAGFLHGLTTGRSLGDCAVLGSLAAAEIIGHFGARPEKSLAELARARWAG